MTQNAWKTREGAAQYLGVSREMIDKLAREGDLPKYLLRRRPMFRVADLEKLVRPADEVVGGDRVSA
jgi:excisionase family DNA binding protein